ncbi:MAG TPA: 8-oxo-dGTP diphosphatase [Candidatus Andersenbacteria bacterium]|nr:8-oxo-dGTP diphosphatase [Candidatus Andersenbacteria bacterium]
MKKILTLCLIRKDDQILLGMKKRGFGAGRWNGFGGKVASKETIEDAMRRETMEEAGIEIVDATKIGILEFTFESNPDTLEVHIFNATSFTGEPQETEEMKPKWFHINEIPFDTMWADDIHWFPLFLEGKKFTGKFLFDSEGNTIIKQELQEVITL